MVEQAIQAMMVHALPLRNAQMGSVQQRYSRRQHYIDVPDSVIMVNVTIQDIAHANLIVTGEATRYAMV